MRNQIREICKIAIAEVISSHNHDSSSPKDQKGTVGEDPNRTGEDFTALCEERLRQELDKIGVTFVAYGRTKFEIHDKAVAHSMAEQTVKQTEAITARTTAQNIAETKKIEAENYAETLKIRSEADAKRTEVTENAKIEAAKKWKKEFPELKIIEAVGQSIGDKNVVYLPTGSSINMLPLLTARKEAEKRSYESVAAEVDATVVARKNPEDGEVRATERLTS